MALAVQVRSVGECGMLARSGSGVLPSAADRLTACRAGGRRPRFGKNLSSRGCFSKGRGGGSFWKSCPSAGARFLILSETCPNHRARRDCLVMVRPEEDENGTEKTPDCVTPAVANLGQPIPVKKSALLTSLEFWLQVAIFAFAAGFVDAGFSGDWSRIGVLSKQTEEELQMAAIGVVPLAITLIWSISQRRKNL